MKYFTIVELSKSSTATAKKLDNTPTKETEDNLIALIENVLDPLRETYGKPITVTSGYRSTVVNNSVNGAKSSQHLLGEAADITAGSKAENKKLFEIIKNELPFDLVIDEKNFTWIHVSYRKDRLRKQVLAIK